MNNNSPTRFRTIFAQVEEALAKARLVETMAHQQQGPRQGVIENLVHRQQRVHLEKLLNSLHPADVARVMETINHDDRMLIWQLQAKGRGGTIIMELNDAVLAQLLDALSPEQLRGVLRQLDADDLAWLSESVPHPLLIERLAEMDREEREWLAQAIHYPDGQVGALMSKGMVLVPEYHRLAEIIAELRLRDNLPSPIDKLFVVDHRGHLSGILPWQTLILEKPERTAAEVMAKEVVTFQPEESINSAARAFERYNLISAPVVNERGRPIGRLTIDDVIDFVREEMGEDVLNTAGLKGEEDLFAPIWQSARNRWLWLSLSLLTAFVASRVIGLFEETITRYVALAALMPIVAAIGGNTGNQTTTLVVRGLALDQINSANRRHLIRKELGLSLLNGAVWGSVVSLFALVFYGDLKLAGIIAMAMAITLLLAATLGLGIPLFLHAMRRDPALGSSVLVTALTDSMGFFIFLSLASLFL